MTMKWWYKIFFPVLGIVALASCKKFLEVEPNDRFTGADYWKNAQDARMGVNAAYSIMRTKIAGTTIYNTGDFRAGNWNWFAKVNFAALASNQLWSSQLAAADALNNPRETWGEFYKSIAASNICIDKINKIKDVSLGETERRSLIGEARFIRCFNYYNLVLLYGDVPLQMNPYDISLKPRSRMLNVLDTCIADLMLAEKDLPVAFNDPTDRAVRATKGAAMALMAHMYMWKAGFDKATANDSYQKAADLCRQIIDLGIYRLLPYTKEQFQEIFKGRSEEGIFEISLDANYGNATSRFIPQWVLHQPILASSNSLYGGLGSEITLKREFMDKLYPQGESDGRFTLWFDDPYCTVNPQSAMFLKFSSIPDPTARSFDANQIYFRLAGIILLRAEALAALGNNDAEAISMLNEIRRRANATEYTGGGGKPLQDAIFRERTKELMGEGQRWYDLVRTGRVLDINECENYLTQDVFERRGWTWPIPKDAIKVNPLITQNAYWAQ